MMKRLATFCALAVGVACAPAVLAADMAVKAATPAPAWSWSGFYAGVNAGYGSGTADTSVATNAIEANVIGPPFAPIPLPGALHPNGFIGGGQIGYNYQLGNIVAGLETDLSYAGWTKTDAATAAPSIAGTLTTTIQNKLDWFGTFRARLGVLPTENLLVYATGGVAYGGVQTTTTASNLPGFSCNGPFGSLYCGAGSTSGTSIGWTAGGGLEYAFARQWTVKAEYLYLDLGSRSVTFSDLDNPGGTLTANTGFKTQIVRGELNSRF
jgi:outer membrane immunogenic protein